MTFFLKKEKIKIRWVLKCYIEGQSYLTIGAAAATAEIVLYFDLPEFQFSFE